MRIGRIRKHTSFVILLAVVGIGLAACSTTRDRIWLDAEGWRRAVVVGNTELPDQAPFALDNEGIAHFFVFEEIDGVKIKKDDIVFFKEHFRGFNFLIIKPESLDYL